MANLHFLFTADWHLGSYRTGPDLPGLQGRLLDIQQRTREILNYALVQQIPKIIIAGDIFRDRHPSMLHMTLFAEFLRDANRAGISVWIIPGNHDQSRMHGQVHALSPFMPLLSGIRDIDRVSIFDEPVTCYLDKHILFLPYIKSPQRDTLQALINRCDISRIPQSLLILHGAIEGSILKNMVEYEIFDEDVIPYDMVAGFKGVFAGHIHEQQHFNNVWYPGSIERLTFDDEGLEKYFLDVEFGESLQVFKVPLNARKMMTLKASQINEVEEDDIRVEGMIVRVSGAKKHEVQDIRQVLTSKGVYHILSIATSESINTEAIPMTPTNFDIGDFTKRYAKKMKFAGDLPKATKLIEATLDDAQGEEKL